MSRFESLGRAALIALFACPACKTPDEYREEADREVYDIIDARRGELDQHDEFVLDAPENSLRARLLAGAHKAEGDELRLTLEECLIVAAEDSREYMAQRDLLYRWALDLSRIRWDFSYQETATGGSEVGVDFANPSAVDADAGLGLSKLFASGAKLISSISLNLVRDLGTGDSWDLFSNFSFSLTQPLLRGYGRDIVLEPLRQAERDVMYGARTYERFRRTFAFEVAASFYRIIQQRDTLRNERANYASLVRIRERNQAFAEAGRLSDIQVDQALQDELRAEDRVVESRRLLETRLDDFKFDLGLPIDARIELVESEETAFGIAELLERDLAEELAVSLALGQRLDYLTVIDRVEDSERGVVVAENALLGGFDITASASGSSQADQPGKYNADEVSWSLGAALDLPIDRLLERNVYRRAILDHTEALRDEQELRDRIIGAIRAQLRELAARRESFGIQTGAVTLARRRVTSSRLNQEAGRADTRDVLEAQEDLIQAENDATQAFTDYTLAGLALYRDMGLLRVIDGGVTVESELIGVTEPGLKPHTWPQKP